MRLARLLCCRRRGTDMSHRLGVAVALVVALVAVASCSSSSADKVPSASDSGSTMTSGSPPPSWSPPDYGAAQPAVDAYLKLIAASDAAYRDPAHVTSAAMDTYLAGQAKQAFDESLAAMKAQGIAYRGMEETHRVTVVSADLTGSVPEVVLHDCALPSATDPFVGYYVATGKPVPTSTPTVPPPYAKTAKVFRPVGTAWVITSFTTDAGHVPLGGVTDLHRESGQRVVSDHAVSRAVVATSLVSALGSSSAMDASER